MITNNFKAILATTLVVNTSTRASMLHGVDVDGNDFYIENYFSGRFPGLVESGCTLYANQPGISVGSDNTQATATDYNLGSTITSGVSLDRSSAAVGSDGASDPYIEYLVTVTNLSDSQSVTINEIGYKQNVAGNSSPREGASSSFKVLLIDRTVLDSPLVIPAGGSGVITYRLKTVTSQ